MRHVLTAWSILLALIATIVALGLAALPGGHPTVGAPVLVIAPPWGPGAAAIVARAGGKAVGPVDAAFGTLAAFDGTIPVEKMRALGAWSVRDGASLALICGVTLE